jgi:hypothetical protein
LIQESNCLGQFELDRLCVLGRIVAHGLSLQLTGSTNDSGGFVWDQWRWVSSQVRAAVWMAS